MVHARVLVFDGDSQYQVMMCDMVGSAAVVAIGPRESANCMLSPDSPESYDGFAVYYDFETDRMEVFSILAPLLGPALQRWLGAQHTGRVCGPDAAFLEGRHANPGWRVRPNF